MERVIILVALLLAGCAGHQDLLAPVETGEQIPVNQQWQAIPSNTGDRKEKR